MAEWRWGNEHRLHYALDKVKDPDVLDDLLDALDQVLEMPYEIGEPMRGTMYATERWIAPLPHGWYIVFTPCPGGVPPATSRPTLIVRDLYPITELFD